MWCCWRKNNGPPPPKGKKASPNTLRKRGLLDKAGLGFPKYTIFKTPPSEVGGPLFFFVTMFDNTANDPELNGKYLGTISKDFVLVADVLKEASYAIRKRGFSDHPIFPVAKVDIPIGRLLVRKYEIVGTDWNYYVSYLDEFMQRQLVEDEAFFRENYKAPDEYCCLFVVDETFTNFVFIPYPED